MKILELEITNEVYQSVSWEMYVNVSNAELQKELNKTYYIKDKEKRLNAVRELLKDNENDNKIGVEVTAGTTPDYKGAGFKDFTEFKELQSQSIFYNIWSEVANKRALEIEVYVLERYNHADTLALTDEYKAICFLIDEQYTYHTGVFDNAKSDFAHQYQYNQIIYDLLQKKIRHISKIEIEDIRETLTKVTRKPLTWNAKKSSIGTLFGMLHNSKIITGTKEDLIRALGAMFNNLSKDTLKANINLKINTTEEKTQYDTKTETALTDWIKYLKSTTNSK